MSVANEIQDLALESEVLPLFDFTLQAQTKQRLKALLQQTLPNATAVEAQQNTLKALIAQHKVLGSYTYSPLYFNEVFAFLQQEHIEDLSARTWHYRLFSTRKQKHQQQSQYKLLVLFLHKLEFNYFSRLSLTDFPEAYKRKIQGIQFFLAGFKLSGYQAAIQADAFKLSHSIALSQHVHQLKEKGLVKAFWEDLFEFEALLSVSIAISKNDFVFPELGATKLLLQGFYHPALTEPVKNDFSSNQRVNLINGANMSGKSTFLKSISLCVYLAHLGWAVPAKKASLPFIDYFGIHLHKRDALQQGYSHFMQELMYFKQALLQAQRGNSCWVVFDEFFNATNAEDARVLTQKSITGLNQWQQGYCFIATHLLDLSQSCLSTVGTYHLACQIKEQRPAFTYRLVPGWSTLQVGQLLFKQEGLEQLLVQNTT
ncbi:hypothetical protein ACFSQ0_00225 [Mesonia sediminis]|uniref:DNA mismatch repair proteins mutS family domain-containing protein n=1 Tax=Mesonia sediminis TaxID=1703946 RepID=A0ABW5S9C4_9FLAO